MTKIGEVEFTNKDRIYTANIWKTEKGYLAGSSDRPNYVRQINLRVIVRISLGIYEPWEITRNTLPEEDWNRIIALVTAEEI